MTCRGVLPFIRERDSTVRENAIIPPSLFLSLSLLTWCFILLLLPFFAHVNPPRRRPEANVFY